MFLWCFFSFYFTYEALKLEKAEELYCVDGLFLLYLWGIETQEGAKLWICQGGFLLYLWGIETAIAEIYPDLTQKVFTLPMRNWNFVVCILLLSAPFCFYFTYEELKPWIFSEPGCLPKSVFTLPMRNWNTLVPKAIPPKEIQFLLYLWGIETPLRRPGDCW